MSSNGIVSKHQYKTAMQSGPLVAPKELLSHKYKSIAAPVGRNPVFTPVDTRMPVSESNPIIEIKLGNSPHQWIDFNRGCILVKVSLTRTAGTYIRPSNLIANMIEKFELIDGNTLVEDYPKYGEKYTLDYLLNRKLNASQTSGISYYGEAAPATRSLRHATSAAYEYKLPITSDILSKLHAFPNFEPFAKGSDQITLRWHIAKAAQWIESDAGAANISWSITQFDLYKDHVDMEDSGKYIKMLMDSSSSLSGSLKYSWVNDDVTIHPLTNAQSQSIVIEQKKSSIQGMLVTVRQSADVFNPAVDDKFETWYGPNHPSAAFPLISYQWRHDTKAWPDRPVRTQGPNCVEGYWWLQKWMDHESGTGNLQEVFDLSGETFSEDKFVMVLDARAWPQLRGEVYNNVSTLKSNNALHLNLEFSAPPAAGLQLVVHTFHDKDWFFGYPGGGKVVW